MKTAPGLPDNLDANQIWEVETFAQAQSVVLEHSRYLVLIASPPEGWARTHLARSHCNLGDLQKDKPTVILERLWELHNHPMVKPHWTFNLLRHGPRKLHYLKQRGYWE